MKNGSRLKWTISLVVSVLLASLLLLQVPSGVDSAKSGGGKGPAAAPPAVAAPIDESVIEEVTAKQLERLLHDKDYVAVYWCKSSSRWRCPSWRPIR